MGKKKVIYYEYVAEKMAEFADVDDKLITNDKAKHVLGSMFRIPAWLQVPVINQMCEFKLLIRENQKIIRINGKNKILD